MSADVVITGLGIISPIGIGAAAMWDSFVAGRSGVKPLSLFDASSLPIRFGGEVSDFDGKIYVRPRKSLKVMSRDIQLAFAASDQAWTDAGLAPDSFDPERFGVVFGSDLIQPDPEETADAYRGCMDDGEFDFRRWGDAAVREIAPLWMLKHLPNMPACHVGIAFDARGPNNTITLGEVSASAALAEAMHVLRRGRADLMLSGGTGTRVKPTTMVRNAAGESSQRNDAPERASRPFDAERDGEVHGEAAATFVLETSAHAARRGAKVLAKFAGAGSAFGRAAEGGTTSDAVAASIRRALEDAEIAAEDVGLVVAAGRSTQRDDAAEATGIHAALGDVPVTAPSSFYGNVGSASGALGLATAVGALRHGTIPPTLNYETPDAACPVRVVATRGGAPLEKPCVVVVSQSPMGQATALVITS